jgi:hypothetical protein
VRSLCQTLVYCEGKEESLVVLQVQMTTSWVRIWRRQSQLYGLSRALVVLWRQEWVLYFWTLRSWKKNLLNFIKLGLPRLLRIRVIYREKHSFPTICSASLDLKLQIQRKGYVSSYKWCIRYSHVCLILPKSHESNYNEIF